MLEKPCSYIDFHVDIEQLSQKKLENDEKKFVVTTLNPHIYLVFRTKDCMKSYLHEMSDDCDDSEFVGGGHHRRRINLTTGRTINFSPPYKPPSKPMSMFKTLRKSG